MTTRTAAAVGALALLLANQAHAQFAVTFQNGLTLPTGVVYEGTDDVEFVSADLTGSEDRSGNPTITVDGNDGGNIAQGAIRFNNLLISEGGAIPDEVATNPDAFSITRATLSFFKTSPTGSNSEIAFHRVIAPNTPPELGAPRFWEEDDSWADLTFNIFPDGPNSTFVEWPFGPADMFQFTPAGTPLSPATGETELTPDFYDPNEPKVYTFQGSEFVIDGGQFVPRGVDPAFGEHSSSTDSQDILNALESRVLDAADPLTFRDAFAFSFFDFDVTDAVVDWLVNGEANQGWSISNNSGDGWDVIASELTGSFDHGFFDGETVIPGVENLTEEDLPYGVALGENPGTLTLVGEGLRPALTVFYDGAGGAADLDFDGDADLDDFDVFLAAFGSAIDGPLTLGAAGDLDFDRDVDPADFLLFKQAFADANSGMTLSAALNASAAPEPTAALLAAVGGLALFVRRNRA